MRLFKNWIILAVLLLIVLYALYRKPAGVSVKSVAVTAIVEHPALNAVRDGVCDGLKDAGFIVGKNLQWQYQSAQGDASIAAQIARQFVGARPDVIVAISTPSAQAVAAATKTIPVAYAGITDPIAARLVKDWNPSGTNITGVSDAPDLKQQLHLIKQLVPQVKRMGTIYNPGEVNSITVVTKLKQLLSQSGIMLVEATAARPVDVGPAAKNLVDKKVDLIYVGMDNNIASAYEALAKVSADAKIPLIGNDPNIVQHGATMGIGMNDYDLGRQTGQIVARILNGEKPGHIASIISDQLELTINMQAAQKQGVIVPSALIKSATRVIK